MTPYILTIKNFMTPLFFFPKIYDPSIFGTPIPKKMIVPLLWHVKILACFRDHIGPYFAIIVILDLTPHT